MPDPQFGDCAGIPRRNRRSAAVRKDFPPPISWLAHTESLPSHMPWVMRKYSTTDGRLIIREERVKRHDYFLADRSDGRLVLNLVHVDEDEDDDDVAQESGHDSSVEDDIPEIAGGEDVTAECYKYNGLGLKPCGGFVATLPVFSPPVHT